jgi:hypothetical protein
MQESFHSFPPPPPTPTPKKTKLPSEAFPRGSVHDRSSPCFWVIGRLHMASCWWYFNKRIHYISMNLETWPSFNIQSFNSWVGIHQIHHCSSPGIHFILSVCSWGNSFVFPSFPRRSREKRRHRDSIQQFKFDSTIFTLTFDWNLIQDLIFQIRFNNLKHWNSVQQVFTCCPFYPLEISPFGKPESCLRKRLHRYIDIYHAASCTPSVDKCGCVS